MSAFIGDEFGPEVTSYPRRQAGLRGENRMGAAESVNVHTGDGRSLEALVSGPPDGTILVFHTGTPVGLVPLPAGLDPAPMGIRTVLYARPGYGRSTPQAGRTVADAAGDTAAILDALGADKFLNLGWSGGGPYALACDALLADRCLATGVVAGLAPYTEAEASSPVRTWYEAEEDNQLALAGDIGGFRQAIDAFVAQLASAQAENIAAEANGDADRRFFSQGYAEWVASFVRAGGASGSHGAADDCLASFRDWGFPLARVRQVTIWQGTEDQSVPLFHAEWLRDHLPRAELRILEGESHNSIVGHLPEIIDTLIA
jgi:pimeloyl-ACP methyl ester carboxylesterase